MHSQGSSQIIQIASRNGSFFAIPTHLGSCLRNLALRQLTLTTSNSGEWKNIKSCFFISGPVIKVHRVHFFQRRAYWCLGRRERMPPFLCVRREPSLTFLYVTPASSCVSGPPEHKVTITTTTTTTTTTTFEVFKMVAFVLDVQDTKKLAVGRNGLCAPSLLDQI